MEELQIKSELLNMAQMAEAHDDNQQTKDEGITDIASIKKRRMEIEIDFSLIKTEPRERRAVKRFVETQEMPRVRKKNTELKSVLKDAQEMPRKKSEDTKSVKSADIHICNTCYQYFDTEEKLKIHKEVKHFKIDKFTCALCSETFNSNAELLKHKIIHNNEERNFLCMTCQMAFSDHLKFLKHKVVHENGELYFCIECGREYDKKSSYVAHLYIHYSEMVMCEHCNRSVRSNRYEKHVRDCQNITSCVECGKEIPKSSIKYHMLSHTGLKPVQCLYCGRGFKTTGARNIHTRTHTGEKPYECTICHIKHRQQADLQRHMAAHVSKKDVECEVCKKKFTRQDSLNKHMDIHNNTQKYTCRICAKKLHTHTGLRSHILHAHNNEKKFSCALCSVAFKTQQDLNRHFRKKKHINNQFGYDRKMKDNKDKD